MPKPCTGAPTNNSDLMRESRAFCEGLSYRAQGNSTNYPFTDNPHAVGSDANTAWSNGWLVTNGAVGATVDPADAPCCAVPQNTIL